MSVKLVSDICGSETSKVLNTGGKKQCPPKPTETLFVSKEDFAFANADASRLGASWKTAISNKDILPLYKVEEFSDNNTDQKKYEGRFEDYVSEDAVKGTNYNSILGDCSYEALKSIEGSDYTRLFIGLTDGTFRAETLEDGKIAGLPLSSYSVGILTDSAIDGKPQNADIQVKFKDFVGSTIKPTDFDINDLEGIFDATLTVVGTPTSTEIIVKATVGCSSNPVNGLLLADFKLLQANGTTQTISAVSEADGVYTLTGTGFVTGTLETNGVVKQTNAMYEAEATTITI